jgi:hypothetical protein
MSALLKARAQVRGCPAFSVQDAIHQGLEHRSLLVYVRHVALASRSIRLCALI